ncbi:hypothetical protein IFM89_004657 [Coptis chinensis]|uniref:Uncharacterized protein n=1 Tax=Coptis chinensis TaxID=261450 RepID=A0A835M3T0_9MAGN|nr:hypothetical protein IFM89_004657 [Coptis chinensis]
MTPEWTRRGLDRHLLQRTMFQLKGNRTNLSAFSSRPREATEVYFSWEEECGVVEIEPLPQARRVQGLRLQFHLNVWFQLWLRAKEENRKTSRELRNHCAFKISATFTQWKKAGFTQC